MDRPADAGTDTRKDDGTSTVTFANAGIPPEALPHGNLAEPLDIDVLMLRMTTEQKCALLTGKDAWNTQDIPELGIPSIRFSDGPHGLRGLQDGAQALGDLSSRPATCFPTASATACTFDIELMERMGEALGEECRMQGVDVLLGPGINMKRDPRCGRNFEYLSEDPLLAGRLAAAYIRGVQSRGVGTSAKHFACNNQERMRMSGDSIVDDRALFEYYLRAFEMVVHEAQPWTIMAAYNRLNGDFCCQNRRLLTDIARETWGFEGAFISDWGAQSSNTESLPAGLDLVMPGPRPDYRKEVAAAVADGTIGEKELDDAAERVLRLVNKVIEGRHSRSSCDIRRHLDLARSIAEQSAVLLENDGILPLVRGGSIAVIGEFARKPRYQGSGSSQVNPVETDCAYDALCDAGAPVVYARAYDAETSRTSEWMMREAEMAAAHQDVAVVFIGLPASYEAEGLDRADMALPASHVELVERVCKVNPNTVVVLQCGAPVEMPWRDKPRAILLSYLSGCQGGKATANLLLGRANPCGKLAETWPLSAEDTFLKDGFPDEHMRAYYNESIFVGYRYHDAAGVEVAYPFGHGLSYTQFDYSDLVVTVKARHLSVSCDVTNTGETAGREAVQLYIAPMAPGAFKAPQELKAFAKVELGPGQTKTVEMELGKRAFAHFNRDTDDWVVEEGNYEFRIGASSRDIRLVKAVQVDGEAKKSDKAPEWYHAPSTDGFSKQYFRRIYRKPMPTPPPKSTYTVNSTIGDIKDTRIGKLLIFNLTRQVDGMAHGDANQHRMLMRMMLDLPLRSLTMAGMSMDVARGIAELANDNKAGGLRLIAFNLPSLLGGLLGR